ncbi:MAG TPA: hypothetical protein VMW56_00055 [Candidatus Margulisiibacteriota bacterium]|nr:hypothetical protein [Candidatus Margulisiibacteriota bacterium]
MQNLPNFSHAEVAVLAAAALLLFLAPAVLSWADELRRRRARHAAIAVEALGAASTVELIAPRPDVPAAESAPADALHGGAAWTSAPETLAGLPIAEAGPIPAPAVAADAAAASEAPPAPMPPELHPLSGTPRHRFRLDDLHLAQLADWPPAAIRNDPERSGRRQEAERCAETYRPRIDEALIFSPYPARSYCLGTADSEAAELRLSFLLFPVLWPVSQNQAVAQAVFRVDCSTGEIRGWVDALRPQELSEENRREIHEAGGDA